MSNKAKLTSQSKADGDILSKESFTLIVNIISIALIFGSVLNLAAQYFIYGDDLAKVLTLSGHCFSWDASCKFSCIRSWV